MPIWIISLLSQLKNIKGVAAMANFLPSPAKFWREYIILILLGIIAFGGWYYSSSKAKLQIKYNNSELSLHVATTNRDILGVELTRLTAELDALRESNQVLEEMVAESIIAINEKPMVIYVDRYKDPLPLTCDDKFGWLKEEALKLGSIK